VMLSNDPALEAKRVAGRRAADMVESEMRLGLGTGSTVAHFLNALAERVQRGLKVVGVPTSEQTRIRALELAIPIGTLDDIPELDLVVDGADEFDPALRLIKGGGGALLREKIVAAAARRMIVITDASKKVETLGRFPLPLEVAPFGVEAIRRNVVKAACRAGCAGPLSIRTRADGHAFVTDGGHYILDCQFGSIANPDRLACELSSVPGVLGHGLFIGMADMVLMADGSEVVVFETNDTTSHKSGDSM